MVVLLLDQALRSNRRFCTSIRAPLSNVQKDRYGHMTHEFLQRIRVMQRECHQVESHNQIGKSAESGSVLASDFADDRFCATCRPSDSTLNRCHRYFGATPDRKVPIQRGLHFVR